MLTVNRRYYRLARWGNGVGQVTLSIITEEEMELQPGSGNLFLFCSRDRKLIKCIFWDRNGFCLWQKRLEKGKYPWPETEEQARAI